jgi:amidophosphoribosyltransferase
MARSLFAHFGAQDIMCGIFGVFGHPEAANLTYLGLHALQHRGQESAGIVTSDERRLVLHRGMGRVTEVFSQEQLKKLQGTAAIGHVRYSTSGGSHLKNAQPLAVEYTHGSLAVSHNGNLTNAQSLRERLERQGSIFHSASDSEVILHLMAQSREQRLEDRIAEALHRVEGAYSLLFLTEKRLIAVRDPLGIRPLCVGRLGTEGAWVIASEASSFELIGATFEADLQPGEMLVLDATGVRRSRPFPTRAPKRCVLEYIYFSRSDSVIDNISVYDARKELGRALARQDSIEADIVIPVPDSAIPAAIGYAQEAGLPFEMGLVRSPYVGRTFIEPEQSIRHFGVRLKHNAVHRVLRGKRVVVVDDSIVRGTTSRKIVKMIRAAGALEVHLRISSPQVSWPCYYGIDTPTRSELIAPSHTAEEIRQYLTCDTLAYLPLSDTLQAVLSGTLNEGERVAGPPAVLSERPSEQAFSESSEPVRPAEHEVVALEGARERRAAAWSGADSDTVVMSPVAISPALVGGSALVGSPVAVGMAAGVSGAGSRGRHVSLPLAPPEASIGVAAANTMDAEHAGSGSDSPFCDACFSGNYPVPFEDAPSLRQMRLLDF